MAAASLYSREGVANQQLQESSSGMRLYVERENAWNVLLNGDENIMYCGHTLPATMNTIICKTEKNCVLTLK